MDQKTFLADTDKETEALSAEAASAWAARDALNHLRTAMSRIGGVILGRGPLYGAVLEAAAALRVAIIAAAKERPEEGGGVPAKLQGPTNGLPLGAGAMKTLQAAVDALKKCEPASEDPLPGPMAPLLVAENCGSTANG